VNNSTENSNNRKEEILAKVRQLNNDEGLEHLDLKGKKLGEYTGFYVLGSLMFLFSIITGQFNVAFALFAVSCGFDAGNFFAIYRISKQSRYLIGCIVAALLSAFAVFFFVANALEWQFLYRLSPLLSWGQ